LAHINQIKHPDTAAVDLKARLLVAGSTSTAEIEAMLSTDPNNALLLARLCGAFRRDEPRKAIEYCRRASELEPSNIDHAVGFAAALVQAKLYEQAVTVLDRVVSHAPNNATARANLATALFQLKRYPEAMKEFRWMADDQPGSAAPYYFIAIIHDQLNEFADAMANYQQYLRLADPAANKEDIEKVNLRLPAVQRLVKDGKGKRRT
jgi:tetratricopeptide (TPR) repeat protein